MSTKIEGEIRYLNRLLNDYFDDYMTSTVSSVLNYDSFRNLKENLAKFSRPYLIEELKTANLEALEPLKEFIKENKPYLDSLDISKFEGIIDTEQHKKLIKEIVDFKKEHGWRKAQEINETHARRWDFITSLGIPENPIVKTTVISLDKTESLSAFDEDELNDILSEWLDRTEFMASKTIYYS